MKKVVRQVALLAAALLLICVACRLTMRNTYVDRIPVSAVQARSMRVVAKDPGTLDYGEPGAKDGYVQVSIRPRESGEAWYELRDGTGVTLSVQHYRVGRFMTLYDYDTGGFTGDGVVMVALTAFWLGVGVIMVRAFRAAKGPAFYAYDTIYYVGFAAFSLVTGATMLILTLRRFIDPAGFTMYDAYSALSGAGAQFMVVTLPALLVFAAAMAVSNVALLTHRHPQLKNVLGLLVSGLLVAGAGLGIFIMTRGYSGSHDDMVVRVTLENVYTTAFAYCECMLAGAVVCGTLAAKRQPAPVVDFIIILGCWFQADGTLPPELKGRVDRALAYWREQKAATGEEAVLVPSGGQGNDEPMPEAEAMRRYLLAQGVSPELIMAEDRSTNTYQNMEYSKKLIEARRPGGRTAFATTNYHVFRSGVWAARAGLKAEGMGSRAAWWYWPNAFMRECAGLLQYRWKQELMQLAALTAFFAVLSMVLIG